jgi:hypothetical protein
MTDANEEPVAQIPVDAVDTSMAVGFQLPGTATTAT